jgi:hypothetical protein
MELYLQSKEERQRQAACRTMCATAGNGGATMTVTESKGLAKGTRVYWRGNAAHSGIITEVSWDAVTIAWNNGQVATRHARNSASGDKDAYCAKAAVISSGQISFRGFRDAGELNFCRKFTTIASFRYSRVDAVLICWILWTLEFFKSNP